MTIFSLSLLAFGLFLNLALYVGRLRFKVKGLQEEVAKQKALVEFSDLSHNSTMAYYEAQLTALQAKSRVDPPEMPEPAPEMAPPTTAFIPSLRIPRPPQPVEEPDKVQSWPKRLNHNWRQQQ
jgi:hypothetical protein